MPFTESDALLLASKNRGEEIKESIKAKAYDEAFNKLRSNGGLLIKDPQLKVALEAAEGFEGGVSSFAGRIMTAVTLWNDLNGAVRLLDTAPRYDLGYNSVFAEVGSSEIGASRAWYDAAIVIEQKAKALEASFSFVAGVLAFVPGASLAAAGLGILGQVFGQGRALVQDIVDIFLADLVNKSEDMVQNVQSFLDLPEQGGIGRFIPKSGGGGSNSNQGATSTRSSSPDNPGLSDPIVIDLKGDGIELTPLEDPVFFDRQGNGIATATGWVFPTDALLARDVDGDGKIRTQAELFGNETLNAFDDLATHDDDGNGLIDENDAIWASLRIWQDLNQDGESSARELSTPEENGIAAISLDRVDTTALITADNFDSVIETYDISGNQVDSEGYVIMSDGRKQDAFAISFAKADSLGREILPKGFVLNPQAAELPNLPASGTLSSLAVAMTQSPKLLKLMKSFVADAPDFAGPEFEDRLEQVFQQWSGIRPRDYSDETVYRSAFLSKMLMADPSIPFVEGADNINAAYNQFMDSRGLRIAIQIGEKIQEDTPGIDEADNPFHAAAALTYTPSTQGVSATGRDFALRGLTEALGAAMTGDVARDFEYLAKAAPALRGLFTDFYESGVSIFADEFGQLISDALGHPLLINYALDLIRAPALIDGNKKANQIEVPHEAFMRNERNDVSVVEGGKGDDRITHGDLPKNSFVEPNEQLSLVYRRGDGHDTVETRGDQGALTRLYLPDFTPGDVLVSQSAAGAPQLLLGTGSVTFTGLSSEDVDIEVIFANGQIWQATEVLAASDLAGDNTITGTNAADVLLGGKGDDTLEGLAGDDTYIFRKGDGEDSVVELSKTIRGIDTVYLQDVMPDDLVLSVDGDDAVLSSISAPRDKVRLVDQFSSAALDLSRGVEFIRLADGSELSADDLIRLRYELQSTRLKDVITGTSRDEVFVLKGGSDEIDVGRGNNTVIREPGIAGGAIITGSVSKLVLGDMPEEIEQVTLAEDSIRFKFDNGSSLVIIDYLSPFSVPTKIIYPDGTEETGGELRTRFDPPTAAVLMPIRIEGDKGDEILTGTANNDFFPQSLGDDIMRGGVGSDMYEWDPGNIGRQHDIIEERGQSENASSDYLIVSLPRQDVTVERLHTGDLRLTYDLTDSSMTISRQFTLPTYEIEYIFFLDDSLSKRELKALPVIGDSDDQSFLGSADSETIFARAGDDRVLARDGDDVVDGENGNDTLSGEGGDDTLRGGSGNDTLNGGDGDDTLSGDNGDDTLNGNDGDDTLLGGSGNDRLNGDDGDDDLTGGGGDDALEGEAGSDTYYLKPGDGTDTLTDSTLGSPGDRNTLVINGVDPGDLQFLVEGSSGTDLRIRYTNKDSVLIEDQFNSLDGRGIFSLQLDNGLTLSTADMRARSEVQGTNADETIVAPNFDTRIDSGGGDDTIFANFGNHVFFWGAGDGKDTIQSTSALNSPPEDRIVLSDLSLGDVTFSRGSADPSSGLRDLVIKVKGTDDTLTIENQFGFESEFQGRRGVSFLEFEDVILERDAFFALAPIEGTRNKDVLEGSSPADAFMGGRGADKLSGFGGGDRYIWNKGDGNDSIDDLGSGGIDVLEFRDLRFDEAALWRDPGTGDVLIGPDGSSEAVRIANAVSAGPDQDDGIERVEFSDGTVLTIDQIAAIPFAATAGDDLIEGDRRANVLLSEGGKDTLSGLGGGDIYRPDLRLTTRIDDEAGGTASDGDVLDLSSINQSRATARTERNLPDAATIELPKGKIIIVDQLRDALSGVETIRFADGDVSASAFFASVGNAAISGNNRKNTLTGTWLDEVFDPKGGNDKLTLGGGTDTVKIRAKSGSDTITDFKPGANGDVIEFVGDPFKRFDDVLKAASNSAKGVVIAVDGKTDVSLKDVDKSELLPENFGFGANRTGTRGEDVLKGTPFADIMDARAGDDTLLPGSGDDLVKAGNGNDLIRLSGGSNEVDGGKGNDHAEFAVSENLKANLETGRVVSGTDVTRLKNVEMVTLGSGNDTATGTSGDDLIDLGSGNDHADGGAGDDILLGGDGKDSFVGGPGQDVFLGGDGEDVASYARKASNYLFALSSDGNGLVFDLGRKGADGADFIAGIETLDFDGKRISTTIDPKAPVLLNVNTSDFAKGGSDIVLKFDKAVRLAKDDLALLVDPLTMDDVVRLNSSSDMAAKGKKVTISLPGSVPDDDLSLIVAYGTIEAAKGGAGFGGIADPFSISLPASARSRHASIDAELEAQMQADQFWGQDAPFDF